MKLFLVALGSAAGGVARWLLGELLQRSGGAPAFPAATLLVNVTGSFLIGVLAVVVGRQAAEGDALRLLLMVGFCGGYTTFSSFSLETLALVERGAAGAAALNIAASVALALGATIGGLLVARAVLGRLGG